MQVADEPLIWTEGGPRSRTFGDIYYSLEDGLAESRAVFLTGCGLPEAWAGRSRYCVAELGFGTGLNIVALLHLWRKTRPTDAHLHIFSVEAFPVAREDAARALAAWPEIADEAQALLSAWPGQRRGFHRIDLPSLHATFDLAVMEADQALERWSGKADAWFLDGFAPSTNPAMWSDELLAAVAAKSAPGAVAATFTVAGAVRRGLTAAGFDVAKRPGHGRKRERLEARRPGVVVDPLPPTVAIIGAGIAGASLARAFQAQGIQPVVFASDAPAASGNPAALVTPGLDAGDPVRARLYAESFGRAVQLYQDGDWVIARGARKLAETAKEAARFDIIAGQDIFEPGGVERTADGLFFHDALVIEPASLLAAWNGAVQSVAVTAIEPGKDGWRILTPEGEDRADIIILAAGWGSKALWPDLSLSAVRGQASWTDGVATPEATAFGGYAIPTRKGVLLGATHDRGDEATDVRAADHQRNLETLAKGMPDLADSLRTAELSGRAAVRAATPDRLPIAGEVAHGLYVLCGLGSRGFTTAPLLAEHIAAQVLSLPSPLANDLARRVAPRFRQAGVKDRTAGLDDPDRRF